MENKVDEYLRPDISPEWDCLRFGVSLPANGVTFINKTRGIKVTISYNEAVQSNPEILHVSCSKRDGSRLSDDECTWLINSLVLGKGTFTEIHAPPGARAEAKRRAEALQGHEVTMPDVRHFLMAIS